MTKALHPDKLLAIRCPTCGAAPGQKCELHSGQPRTHPHEERPLTEKD